jgi:hypothetical protein
MRIERECRLFEINDQEIRDRAHVPVVGGAHPVVHGDVQCRASRCRFNYILGVDDVEVSTTDSHVVVEGLRGKGVLGESIVQRTP